MSRNSFQFSARCLSAGAFGGVPLHHLDSSGAGRGSNRTAPCVCDPSERKSTATTKVMLAALLLVVVSFVFLVLPAHAAPVQIDNLHVKSLSK
jgi:hypothetical protein